MHLPESIPSQILDTNDFLKFLGVILDVRSPSEYTHGHIPGAISLPLFTDEERALVGTTYKQQGRDQAVELGLRLVGVRLADLVVSAKAYSKGKIVGVYCARGGMRSASVGWLLQTSGIQTSRLEGGYKSFRKWVLETLDKPRSLKILGGLTGCGKTALLHTLRQNGEQVIDLENLACHRGSSFGGFGVIKQPSNENFENKIAIELSQTDRETPLWIEDESRMIGCCKIPDSLFRQMQQQHLFIVESPQEERLHRLMQEYGNIPIDDLIACTERIRRKLGDVRTKEIVEYLKTGLLYPAAKHLLDYYDATYLHSLKKRNQPKTFYHTSHSAANFPATK